MSQQGQAGGEASGSRGSDARLGGDDWSSITDPSERRKIQNKLAQRRFREKAKEQKEDTEREAHNQQMAASAYTTTDPRQLDSGKNLSGLPWGGVSVGHMMAEGKAKERTSQQSSREASVYNAASRTGGSSR